MLKRCSTVTIGGRELCLLLNTEALTMIVEKYESIEKVAERMDGGTAAQLRIVPDVVSILATQGEEMKGSGDVITPEWIMKHSFPSDLKTMSDAFVEAINKGMNVETPAQNEDVDEVLAELQKNGQSAAGN